MPRKFCIASLLAWPLLTQLTLFSVLTEFPVTTQQLFDTLVQTLKSRRTWQATSLVSLHREELARGIPISHSRDLEAASSACDVIAKLIRNSSRREFWRSFPWLWGGGCLSSPRPRNGSLGCLRGCHQLLEFLDSTPKPPSQRDWLLFSWVSYSWTSQLLQLGRFTYVDHGDISVSSGRVLGITI